MKVFGGGVNQFFPDNNPALVNDRTPLLVFSAKPANNRSSPRVKIFAVTHKKAGA
ncbi:MAG: hypothetical protein JO313_00815 [Verrucomicrobia bacterium]|nr:hypothetical protein [Verrucomicrobiota bacterium]MBV9644256.1 hypothetical protein [Verrucomicrobiota bacterium]